MSDVDRESIVIRVFGEFGLEGVEFFPGTDSRQYDGVLVVDETLKRAYLVPIMEGPDFEASARNAAKEAVGMAAVA